MESAPWRLHFAKFGNYFTIYNNSVPFLSVHPTKYPQILNMFHNTSPCFPTKYLLTLPMNPAMCGASEEDKHRALGGSSTYERRY